MKVMTENPSDEGESGSGNLFSDMSFLLESLALTASHLKGEDSKREDSCHDRKRFLIHKNFLKKFYKNSPGNPRQRWMAGYGPVALWVLTSDGFPGPRLWGQSPGP